MIYNEGWAQETRKGYPEFPLTEVVRSIDPTRLVNSVSGWHDHGAGDYHVSGFSCTREIFDAMPLTIHTRITITMLILNAARLSTPSLPRPTIQIALPFKANSVV